MFSICGHVMNWSGSPTPYSQTTGRSASRPLLSTRHLSGAPACFSIPLSLSALLSATADHLVTPPHHAPCALVPTSSLFKVSSISQSVPKLTTLTLFTYSMSYILNCTLFNRYCPLFWAIFCCTKSLPSGSLLRDSLLVAITTTHETISSSRSSTKFSQDST